MPTAAFVTCAQNEQEQEVRYKDEGRGGGAGGGREKNRIHDYIVSGIPIRYPWRVIN